MSQFRLVFLEYPKKQLENEEAAKIYSDIIWYKQSNFRRTEENFIIGDKLDMLASHLCIYDTSRIYKPKLVLAIRNTYQDRAKEHRLTLPVESWINYAGLDSKVEFERAQRTKGILVDCNAWFVDPEYSFKKTGVPLSEIGFFMVCLQAMRLGYDHFIGCTNEMYKASRWVEKVGAMKNLNVFDHPMVPGKHRMTYIESFDQNWLSSCITKYGSYIVSAQDLAPSNLEIQSLTSVMEGIARKSELYPLAA